MAQQKHSHNREEEANLEIQSTRIERKTAKTITIVFLALIAIVPLVDLFVSSFSYQVPSDTTGEDSSQGVWSEVVAGNNRLIEARKSFESELEKASFLREVFPSPFQWFLTRCLRTGNEKAVMGREGWWFYDKDIQYVTGKPFLQYREQAGKDPVTAITDFSRQLEERGIRLVVMPVPVKPMLYPEMLGDSCADSVSTIQNASYRTFLSELQAQGILVFDPTSILQRLKAEGIASYLKTDTHWTPEGMEAVADSLAHLLVSEGLMSYGAAGYLRRSTPVDHLGDIYAMLEYSGRTLLASSEQVETHPVTDAMGNVWMPDPYASCLFLGDSFSNIYSLNGLGWGYGAGFAEQLSYLLQQPVDAIRRNDEGSIATRKMLSNELERGVDRLANKSVVVWEFSMRELSFGDWTPVAMHLGEPHESDFLNLQPGDSIVVSAYIAARSASPDPQEVTYSDHVITLHLTDICSENHSVEQAQAVVYLLGMKDRRLTDAATVIVSGVGSLFGSGKMKKLELSNEELRQEIAKRDKGIDDLKAQMQHMQEQYGRQIRNLQGIHNQELEAKDKEISRLNTLLEKAHKWFPMLREMLRMEKLCAAIGFTKEMIESLLTKKEAIRCNGRIYSEEHRRKFDIKNDRIRPMTAN